MESTYKYNGTGLTDAEVTSSRATYGDNTLTPPRREPLWKLFLDRFRDPLIVILLIAGILSIGISCYEYWGLDKGRDVFFEPVGIFIAILLATGLAFYFEHKAEREFALLNRVNDCEPVQVIRNGRPTSVQKREVVKGDIVILNTGEEVPADGQLLESTGISVDESTLTGEPMAHKSADPRQADPDATFPTDCLMRGTKLMEGHGIMRVTAVGDHTENGKVFAASQIDKSVKTPLSEQLERLGRLIARVAYVVAGIVIVGRLTLYFMNMPFEWVPFVSYLLNSLMIAVALIAVSVPEGLPMAVTLALAYSMRRMLKTHNLVRKLHACETMGATTVICTDKTGTLTRNRMEVGATDFFGNPDPKLVYEGMAVNSTARLDLSGDAPQILGNPTEGALLLWLREHGRDYQALRDAVETIAEEPFTTERKYMSTTVISSCGRTIQYIKGAPEIVYGMCDDTPGVTAAELEALLHSYQSRAMRTLGFACRQPDSGKTTFMGIAAISDPVRDEVPDAVRLVTDAGIKVKIVTGDTPGTAREIGRRIGLWDDTTDSDRNMITGPDFALLSDNELYRRVCDLKIIARARPMDKKRLVESLQAAGEIVAVTGDGTNDAPALKAAHVGLSMGDGTAVAKEASDITLMDNSFASIGRAVMWGRSLYLNIQRFVLFQMTVNVAACLIVLVGSFMAMDSPLTVTQMLWVNIIMDTFAAMALASLPPSESVMSDKPRDRESFIINRRMWRFIIGTGGTFFILLTGLLYYLEHTDITSLTQIGSAAVHAANTGLTPYELTLFFTIFVFMQFWNMFNARAYNTGRSAFHLRGCSEFVTIAIFILLGQIAIVHIGGSFFNVVPLRISDWGIIVLSTSAVLWCGEALRLLHR